MERITNRNVAEAVTVGLALIPEGVRRHLHADVFTADPVFAGLHAYDLTFDGRSYTDNAHVVFPCHQLHRPVSDRRLTIVFPEPWVFVREVVHEFGHVLHSVLGFPSGTPVVTEYAASNDDEAFAEAFAAWALPFGNSYGEAKDKLWLTGRDTWGLFDAMAAA